MSTLKTTILIATVLVVIVGCGSSATRTEIEFGDAVRQVSDAQIYDRNAAANPDPAAVLGGDPERLNNTLDGHRKDVASPSAVDSPITINVGGNGN